MQDIGFLDRVRQTAAFYQLLAMSSWHLVHLNQICSADEHLQLSLLATQELQMQVNNQLTCSSDDAIGAVLVFACCAVSNLVQARYMRSSLLESNPRHRCFECTYTWIAANVGPSGRLTYT
jgi:hypothetical protein